MRLLVLCLAVATLANAARIEVTLNVFSGGENPHWTLSGDAADAVLAIFNTLPVDTQRPLPWFKMGYSGFVVTVSGMNGPSRVAYNNLAVEQLLLNTAVDLAETVADHVRGDIARLNKNLMAGVVYPEAPAEARPSRQDCTIPVVGPDNSTVYDLAHDDCGYFQTYCTDNNCYNYGNDIVTNTFAQPGRGSGQKWKYNTCDDMKASAERDGLKFYGTDLPVGEPNTGHYVALLIWPNTNFHWIRKDSVPAGYWSHKPGQTPARNVDDDGELITDPAKSDFSPWTEMCGYMVTVPSKVTIN